MASYAFADNRVVDVPSSLDANHTEWQWYWMDKMSNGETWAPFSAHVNGLIVEADKSNASRVQYAIGGTYYELDLDTLRQTNLSTRFARTCRRVRVGENPDPKVILPKEKKYRWYWMNKDWTRYPDNVNDLLENERRRGKYFDVSFRAANGRNYCVNLNTMRQHNNQTQFTRVVKMVEVRPENPFIQWQYSGDKGWGSYDADTKRKLEDEYQSYLIDRKITTTNITNAKSGFTYQVDFVSMTQTNLSTNRRRSIQRKADAQKVAATQSINYIPVSTKGEWVYANDHGGYNAYSAADQRRIEEAYQRGESWARTGPAGRDYVLVFNQMVQVNMHTRFERVIRRHAVASDPVADLLSSNLSALSLGLSDSSALDDKNLCKICMAGEVRVAVLPCAHTYLCVDCAGMNGGVKSCAICRQSVDRTVCLFFS